MINRYKSIVNFKEFIKMSDIRKWKALIESASTIVENDTEDMAHTDHEVSMARSQLLSAVKSSTRIAKQLQDKSEEEGLEGWVASKLTMAEDYLQAVADHMDGQEINEGYKVMPPMDPKYVARSGLEGPFTTLSGKVVYYDPKEGKYYDPDTDIYLSYDEFQNYDKDYSGMKDERDEVKEERRDKRTIIIDAAKKLLNGATELPKGGLFLPINKKNVFLLKQINDNVTVYQPSGRRNEEDWKKVSNFGGWNPKMHISSDMLGLELPGSVFEEGGLRPSFAKELRNKELNKDKGPAPTGKTTGPDDYDFLKYKNKKKKKEVTEASETKYGIVRYPDTAISYIKNDGNGWEHIFDKSYGFEGSVDKADLKYAKKIDKEKIPSRMFEATDTCECGCDCGKAVCESCGKKHSVKESTEMMTEAQFDEAAGEKDACYRKVKSRYKVWPSAYASGALVKCRKVGASNWGNSKK